MRCKCKKNFTGANASYSFVVNQWYEVDEGFPYSCVKYKGSEVSSTTWFEEWWRFTYTEFEKYFYTEQEVREKEIDKILNEM